MVDANQAQEPGTPGSETDLVWGYDRALATCRELAHLDITWMEEPLGRFEFDNLRRLAAATDVPIAGGENNVGLHELRLLIDQDHPTTGRQQLGGRNQSGQPAPDDDHVSISVYGAHGPILPRATGERNGRRARFGTRRVCTVPTLRRPARRA
jgi:hypothetical protein